MQQAIIRVVCTKLFQFATPGWLVVHVGRTHYTPHFCACPACFPCLCSLWHNHKHSPLPPLQRLREAALTSLGLIVIGRPQLMLQNLQLNVSEGALGSGATSAPAHSAGSGDAGSPPRRQLSAQASGMLQGLLSGENVVKVYTSVLSEPDVPMAVKGRVLTNLVELLRWVTVVARPRCRWHTWYMPPGGAFYGSTPAEGFL